MDNLHIILLGDRVKAARFVGYARMQFKQQVERYGPNFQTAINPRKDTHIDMRMFGGVRKIIITVEPPTGATFIGVPSDNDRYGGWGAPYETEDEFGNELPVTSLGIPYGTEFSTTNNEVIIGGGKKGAWSASRYPEYQKKYPDVKYGVIDWLSEDLETCITWDGTNSRHRYKVPNEDDVFHGYSQGTCLTNVNEGLMYIGQVFTRNSLCSTDVFYQYGVFRITGVHKGAIQQLSDYDYEDALSGNVYHNGEVLWSANSGVVTAACMVTRLGGDDGNTKYRQLRVVLGDSDGYRGVYKETLLIINADTGITLLSYDLEEYGNDKVPLEVGNVGYLLPYENVNNGTFSADGKRLLLYRNFITNTATGWNRVTRVIEYVLEPKTDADETNSLEFLTADTEIVLGREILWDNELTLTAPKITSIEVLDNLPDSTYHKSKAKGDFIIAADYKGDIPVYAYIRTERSDETTQTVEKIQNECDKYHLTQRFVDTEYLVFTVNESQKILVYDKDIIVDYTEQLNSVEVDAQKRQTTVKQKIPSIMSVDARYGAAVVIDSTDKGWWRLQGNNDGDVERLLRYEPVDALEQDFSVTLYMNGEPIYESTPVVTVVGYSYTGSEVLYYDCLQVLGSYSPYVLGETTYPLSNNTDVSFAHWQLVTRIISAEEIDVVLSGAWSYPYTEEKPLSRIFRYNYAKSVVLKEDDLSSVLEVADFYNGVPTVRGLYSNIGLL